MDVFFSDFDNYSDSSSSEDQEDNEFMYGGQASCILSNLEETIGKIDDFLLFERGYVHGDIVCSAKDPSGQMGRVIGVDMVVDLENVYGDKLKDINSKNLQRIRSVSTGDYVVAGPWVGKADKIVDRVTVLFDDGTKCDFTTMGEEKLTPLSPDLVDDAQYPYYPGQRVKVELSSMSKSTRWFCGAQKEKQDEGTIYAVDAGFVYVNWLGCALFDSEKIPAPPSLQISKDLTSLSSFSHSNWQLGDWCMLPDTNSAGAVGRNFYMQSRNLRQRSNLNPSFREIYVIAKTKTKVDVLWQDGSQSWGLESNSLLPVNTVDAHDFWPHQFVLEKGTSDDEQIKKWGVVKIVDAQEKIVRVQWETSARKEEKSLEEIVSAYELIEHPDFSYSRGDVVFRLQKGETVKDKDEHHSNFYLSHIGVVIGFEDGIVEVKWAAGFTSKISPDEIFRVDKSESISASPLLHDENTEQNQEKSEHDNQAPGPKEKDSLDVDGDDKDCLKILHGSTPFSVPRAAFEFISSVAARLFGYPAYTSLDSVSENGPKSGIDSEEDLKAPVETFTEKNTEELFDESKDDSFSSTGQNIKEVKQFDMVSDCSEHHFVDGAGKGLISNQVKRGWLKKVQQEWKILQKDLPETIYVRVFEERMDLLHAAIVGAPGTPYHDGLFFFDIFLPPEYPHEPPMVHYNSGGLRVNPNLYESGKVCLSLLNTWTGTGTETWNPEGSTILQVLLSLQALVLNNKPYFNEAGYDRQIGSAEGEKNSCSYNENAFLVSCKTMLYTLRKPPKHFETLVEEHFRQCCKYILLACKAYMEGVPIGCALEGENMDQEGQKGTSTGFKIMLSKLFPKLVEAFTEKEIDCTEFIEMAK